MTARCTLRRPADLRPLSSCLLVALAERCSPGSVSANARANARCARRSFGRGSAASAMSFTLRFDPLCSVRTWPHIQGRAIVGKCRTCNRCWHDKCMSGIGVLPFPMYGLSCSCGNFQPDSKTSKLHTMVWFTERRRWCAAANQVPEVSSIPTDSAAVGAAVVSMTVLPKRMACKMALPTMTY